MHHLAHLAGLYDKSRLDAFLDGDQVVVYGADGQERGNGRMCRIHILVAQDDVVYAVNDRLFGLFTELVQGGFQPFTALCCFEQHRELDGLEAFIADIAKNIQLCVCQYRMGEAYHFAMGLVRSQDIASYGADILRQAHHQLFAERVDRRVRHLCELLAEVVEEDLRTVGEDS